MINRQTRILKKDRNFIQSVKRANIDNKYEEAKSKRNIIKERIEAGKRLAKARQKARYDSDTGEALGYAKYRDEMDEQGRKYANEKTKELAINVGKKIVKPIKEIGQAVNQAVKQFPKPSRVPEKAFKNVSKAYSYNKKLSNTLLAMANAGGQVKGSSSSSSSGRPVGRPRGSLKHRSPFTGQPIEAVEFYRQMRQFRKIQSQKADQVEEQRQRQFAQRGIAPNKINQSVEQNMRRQFEMQRQQMAMPQRQVPVQINQAQFRPQIQPQLYNQVIPQRNNVWATNPNSPMRSNVPSNVPNYGRRTQFIEADIMGNPKVKIAGDAMSFFN